MKDKYPTPDMPSSVTFTSRCVWVPNTPEFIALIGGLMYQPTKEYFWIETGTMTALEASELMRDALALYDAQGECGLTCEQIIDCLENDPDVATALNQYLLDNGFGAPNSNGHGTPNDPSIYNDNPLLIDGSTIEDCTNDNLFGAITQLVDFINRRIVDVFEIIESETNAIERTQIALEAVPVTDVLAADSAASFADQLIEEIAEGYAAAFTEELEDEYRCDLFCLVKDTCELDFQTMADYFNSRIGNTPPSTQFAEYIEWFITGSFFGTNIVDAAYSLVFAALAYASDAFGINIGALLNSINSALNDPNPDWAILCDECGGDFPDLVAGWCVNGDTFGAYTQENANTWLIDFTDAGGANRSAVFQDSGGQTFKILTMEIIAVGSIQAWFRVTPPCTNSALSFNWTGLINNSNIEAYNMGTNDSVAAQIRITVSERNA